MAAVAPPSGPDNTRGLAALGHREFLIFVLSKGAVFTSHHMLMVAVGYQVYDLSGDALFLAYVHLVMVLPSFVFAPFTGMVSDRVDRRTVLAVGFFFMGVATVAVCGLSLAGLVTSAWIYAALLLHATARAVFNPATNAIIPNLVPRDCFPNAVAWNTITTKFGQICGPAIGGVIYLFGPEWVYGSSAALCMLGALGIMFIRARGASAKGKGFNVGELVAGLLYVYRKKLLLGAIMLDLTVILTATVNAILPIIAKDILAVGPAGAGLLRSALAFGGIFSALIMTRFPITRRAGVVMFAGDAILAAGVIVLGFSTLFPLSLFIMCVMGMAEMFSTNIRHTVIQVATPDDMRGRVSAVAAIAGNSSHEIGGFRAGLLTAFIGIQSAIVLGGVVGLVMVAVCWKVFPDLVRVQRVDRDV
jgi:MFS family permease